MEHPTSIPANARYVRRNGQSTLSTIRRSVFPLIGVMIFLFDAYAQTSDAAQLPQQNIRFNYTVLNGRLSDAVQQFGRDVGLRVNVSDAVDGRITSRLSANNTRQFLDTISSYYGLDCYYDGFALFVTTNAEVVSRTIRIPEAGFSALQAVLAKDDVFDPRFPVHAISGGVDMHVSGPPRYVSLVERTAKSLIASPGSDNPVSAVTSTVVFRGSGNQRINFGGYEKP